MEDTDTYLRPAGGGGADFALDFLDRSKAATDIDAKLSVPYPASILTPSIGRSEKSVESLLRKCCFSDVV